MDQLEPRAFENLHPGRRIVFDFPIRADETVSVAVLDSTIRWETVTCAAMLVPGGEEDDWVYSSEGGQWQLLVNAEVSRMVIVQRNLTSSVVDGTKNQGVSGQSGGQASLEERRHVTRLKGTTYRPSCLQCEDEALKARLGSLVVALAPRVCFRGGRIPVVPFVGYSDNIIHRVVVEESNSSLTGAMVVEDVVLDDSDVELLESESSALPSAECSHRMGSRGCRKLERVVYRRRLRFKRMPNLIQTESHLFGNPQTLKDPRTTISDDGNVNTGIITVSAGAFCEDTLTGFQIDHSKLVHKYLPPIVAGLVLAASCIESCVERGDKAKVLALGVGGGALPIFLQNYLGFRVQAVDMDRVVLDLAHRHFGLKNGVDMEVLVGDALQIVDELAWKIAVDDARSQAKSSNCEKSRNVSAGEGEDHRVHAVIVDIDEGDPRGKLSSPPSSFLGHKFLSSARTLLHAGGLLAMNVVPNGAESYRGVVSSLLSVFDDVYETDVAGDVNRVVFALTFKATGVNVDGPLARRVKQFVDARLITGVRRAHAGC